MRPEGALRHWLKHRHWPDWVELGGVAYACRTCVFRGGPRRPLPPLKFAWSPSRA